MAVWQFDIEIVPRSSVRRSQMSLDSALLIAPNREDEVDWWLATPLPFRYAEELSALLPRSSDIAHGWEVFGDEQGNRVDVVKNVIRVELVRLRLDARLLDPRLLADLMALFQKWNCLLLVDGSTLIEPDPVRVWVELELSEAVGFVFDPVKFFARIRERRGVSGDASA